MVRLASKLAAPFAPLVRTDVVDATSVSQHAVGDDLEQRATAAWSRSALVGHGGDAADEAAHLHGLDVLAQRVLLLEPVDDAVAWPPCRTWHLVTIGESRRPWR